MRLLLGGCLRPCVLCVLDGSIQELRRRQDEVMVEIKNGGSPPVQLWCGVREESEMNGSMDGEGGGL